jgi:hypothetical protein
MIFSREIHRPSSAKLWQIPHPAALPTIPFFPERVVPLDAQDTSYLADSANIFSFSRTVSFIFQEDILYKNKD